MTWFGIGFGIGFAGGVLAVVSGMPVFFGMNAVTGIVSTPGVLITLPVINLFDGPLLAVGAIAVANGLIYGLLIAAFVAARTSRKPPSGKAGK